MNNITVYSGEDIVSSRKAFLEHTQSLTNDNYELTRIKGKDLTEEFLELSLSSSSLFGQKKVLIIENLLLSQKSKEKDKLIEKIKSFPDSVIIFWESKEYSKADQLKQPNFIFKNFKLPQILFKFLNKIVPDNKEDNLKNFHLVIQQIDPAYLFLMLIRQFRLLIMASDNETSGMQPWQISNLLKQAEEFKKDDLIKIYKKLLEIDLKQKTSQSPNGLVYELDLLLADI